MKKLLIILMVICSTSYGTVVVVPHNFRVTPKGSPTVTKAQLNYERQNLGQTMIESVAGYGCGGTGNGYRCLFVTKSEKTTLLAYLQSRTEFRLVGSCPILTGLAGISVKLSRSNGEVYSYMTGSNDGVRITVPSHPSSTTLSTASFNVLGSIAGGASQGLYCELYLENLTKGGRVLLTTVTMDSDFSAGGELLGLSVTPSYLRLRGPEWSGSVTVEGAGYPGVLRIRADAPVRIDLGAGASAVGVDFETTITGSSNIVVGYSGRMTVSGTMEVPGVQNYTIKLEYEVI